MPNIKNKIKKIVSDPNKALDYLLHGKKAKQIHIYEWLSNSSDDKNTIKALENCLGVSISEYFIELDKNPIYDEILKKMSENWEKLGVFGMTESRIIYALTRALEPQIIIETGVASGLSSSMFLLAIQNNKQGRLISIDLPPSKELNQKINQSTILPGNKSPGWLIPSELKKNWQLQVGDAKKLLSKAINEKGCDLFLHDSDHSYEHMTWEFETVWPDLKKLLISDDISKNSAFEDFCKKISNPSLKISDRMGIVVKNKISSE